MNKQDFLLEIGCEELPTKSLITLSTAIAELYTKELDKLQLSYRTIQTYATPRRLAIVISDLIDRQPMLKVKRFGPSMDKAFDSNGMPTLACIGFAKSCQVTVDQLQRSQENDIERVSCSLEQPGKKTVDLLPDLTQLLIKNLPIAKPMRWGNEDISFVRPVHWVLMLYGHDIIHSDILGQKTIHETFGHRFHCPQKLWINHPKDYSAILSEQGFVIAEFSARKQLIEKQIQKLLHDNEKAIIDDELLDEVTSLVEWPIALRASFNSDFLHVPKEVLITSMQTHQKCFPIENKTTGRLQPCFIVISNIASKDPQKIIRGNERVIKARLSDAAFFYAQDKKHSLESRLSCLEHVIFQKELGTLKDKAVRLSELTHIIAKKLNINALVSQRAGLLCKCDLITKMVGEFPKLQGVMGYYYSLNDQENEAVALAILEHYLPRYAKDVLPNTLPGCVVALADRLDTLVGILGINQAPTGEKDPFALRRTAQGIFRILLEKKLPLDLLELLQNAAKKFPLLPNPNVVLQSFDFIMERLKYWYIEKGIAPEVFEAVMACHPTEPLDFYYRVEAVRAFQLLPEASALAAANKRVFNLLKKNTDVIPTKINLSLLQSDAEKILAEQLQKAQDAVKKLGEKKCYTEALAQLSTLKNPIDSFFDEVMVMVEDPHLRQNRLALLTALRYLFTQIADIALLP